MQTLRNTMNVDNNGRVDPRVLEPGWGGELTDQEAEFIASQLAIDARLRRLWGFRKRRRYPLSLIRARAYPESTDGQGWTA